MNSLKNNIFIKVLVFIVLQISVVTASMSGVIIGVNAYMGWYSAGGDQVHEAVLSDVASNMACEIHDRMYYEVYYNEADTEWNEYLLKGTEIPDGIGYELKFSDKVTDSEITDISEISLKKNTKIMKNNSDSYVSTSLKNDAYELTVYVADPYYYDVPVSELFPEDLTQQYNLQENVYRFRNTAIAAGAISLVIMIMSFAFLVTSIRKEQDKKYFADRVPADLVCAVAAILIACAAVLTSEGLNMYYNLDTTVLLILSAVLTVSVIVTGTVLFCILKVKRGQLWKSSVVSHIIKLIRITVIWSIKKIKAILLWVMHKVKSIAVTLAAVIRRLPLVWKTIAITVIAMVVNIVLSVNMYWYGEAVVLWVLCAAVISVAVIYTALCMRKLQEGGEHLAAGDLDYKIDKKGLFLDFADHADALNSIGDGMAAAVEEKIKSERFKAELITNVSHDIKTPLTSIINYVDLLSKEEFVNETAREYIEVLDRQSKRLKKLTEDLVDASKASTGNVRIDLAPCKVGLLMTQTMGEYASKAEANDLDFIIKIPEDDVEVLADGRRLWRVFDNLLNNICKYAQPGTRVYMNLDVTDDKAIVTYRNVSKYELDISEEELMERFVRGDKSRNTEGSGLGLSIARNLVELQGGSFDIFIDGDLFKVVIKFNLLNL